MTVRELIALLETMPPDYQVDRYISWEGATVELEERDITADRGSVVIA